MEWRKFILPIVVFLIGILFYILGALFKILHWGFGMLNGETLLTISALFELIAGAWAIVILLKIRRSNK